MLDLIPSFKSKCDSSMKCGKASYPIMTLESLMLQRKRLRIQSNPHLQNPCLRSLLAPELALPHYFGRMHSFHRSGGEDGRHADYHKKMDMACTFKSIRSKVQYNDILLLGPNFSERGGMGGGED